MSEDGGHFDYERIIMTHNVLWVLQLCKKNQNRSINFYSWRAVRANSCLPADFERRILIVYPCIPHILRRENTTIPTNSREDHHHTNRHRHLSRPSSLSSMMPFKSILKQSTCTTDETTGTTRIIPSTNNFNSGTTTNLMCGLTQRPPAAERKNNITFNRQTRVYLIPTLSEWTQEEYDACFITDAESKASQEETWDNIIAMGQGLNDNDEDSGLCFRGIEYMRSAASMSQRNDHKAHVTNSILDAQDEDEDPYHIAAVARRVALPAIEAALAKASTDAAFVRRMQRNDASTGRSPTSTFGNSAFDQYVYMHHRSRALQDQLKHHHQSTQKTSNHTPHPSNSH